MRETAATAVSNSINNVPRERLVQSAAGACRASLAAPRTWLNALVMAFAAAAAMGSGCLRFSAQAEPDQPPIAKVADVSLEAHAGDDVALDGSGSIDPEGDKLVFHWSSDDVAVADAESATAHVTAPAVAGHSIVSLIVSDGVNDSAPADVDIHVNAAPVAHIEAPAATPNLTPATLHGSADDEAGTALSFAWRVTEAPAGSDCADDDGTGCFDQADVADVRFTPHGKGDYSLELVVSDGDLVSAPARASVTATNHAPAPIAHNENDGSGAPVRSNDSITLNSDGTSDVDGDGFTLLWVVASQPSGGAASLSTPTAASTGFTGTRPGAYVVELHAVDDDGADGVTSIVVNIVNSQPDFVQTPAAAVTVAGAPVSLSASATDRDGDVVTLRWTLAHAPGSATGVIDNADSAVASFTPSARSPAQSPADCDADSAGCYIVRVTASDGSLVNNAEVFVLATNRAPAFTAVTPSPLIVTSTIATSLSASASDADGDGLRFSWIVTEASAPGGAVCLTTASACLTGAASAAPAFTAPVEGSYLLQVTVRDVESGGVNAGDDVGGVATATVVVNAGAPPNRAPTLTASSPVSAQAESAVALSAAATDLDGDTVAFSWRVTAAVTGGESCTAGAATACLSGATSPVPLFTPPVAGQFVLEVKADDGHGHVVTAPVIVNAAVGADHAPSVTATSPVAAVALSAVALSAVATDPDVGDTVAFSWRVTAAPAGGGACTAGGGTACLSGATTSTPLFTAPVAGAFVLQVTVSDLDAGGQPRGGAAATSVVVNAAPPPNQPPVAVADADTTSITSGGTVLLDGNASSDVDGTVTAFSWSVVSAPTGGVAIFSPAAADVAAPALTLRGRGQWTVQLIVTDDDGADSLPATVRIGVNNAAPVLTTVTADGANAIAGVARANGTPIAFAATASDLDPQDNAPLGAVSFAWSILDRPAGGGGVLVNAATATPTFTPTKKTAVTNPAQCTPGNCYVLRVTVSDGIASASQNIVVTSANRAPIANAGADQPAADEVVVLDGSASADPDGDAIVATSFKWTQTLGPDVTAGVGFLSGAVTSFHATIEGAYAFSLTVSDGALTSAPDSIAIVVSNVDRPPVVTIANPDVNGVSLTSFGLHVDVTDPDLDNTTVTWSRTAGDATFFPATLSGADPAFTAPSLKPLLDKTRAAGGDNSARYSVVAVDPDGKSSAPLTVNLFVVPGAEHFVVNPASPAADDAANCGSVAHPCRTLVTTLPKANAQARDVVVVRGAVNESIAVNGGTLLLSRQLWAGREPLHFTRSTASNVTCASASAAVSDVTCLTVDAGIASASIGGHAPIVDNLSLTVDDSVVGAQTALLCDACNAEFVDVVAIAGSGASAALDGPLSARGIAVTGTATPSFVTTTVSLAGTCDPIGVLVSVDADATFTDLLVDVEFTVEDCVLARATALQVTEGALTVVRGDIVVSSSSGAALATSDAGGSAAVFIDGNGIVELDDTRVVVDSGDGLALNKGSALLTRSTFGSHRDNGGAGPLPLDGAGLRALASAAALVELTAVTGFAQAMALDDGGAGFSFETSSLEDADPLTSTCAGVPFDPATCDAADVDDAFARSCLFELDFHLVDDVANECIDVASSAGATATDIDGDPRPDASGLFDVGFDEL